MRTFETVQIAVIATAVLLPVLFGARLKRGRMAGGLAVAMVAQLVVEGYRWQLLPVELTTIGLVVGDLVRDERNRKVRGLPRFRRGVLGPVGIAALVVLPLLLPIPEVPMPTGPYAVGTQTFVVIDEDRLEEYGLAEVEEGEDPPEPSEARQLVVQAWYPAADVTGRDAVAWDPDFDAVGPRLARRLGFPGFFLSHADEVPGHAYPDAPALSGRLPVVVYVHGWTGFRNVAVNQMEALASRGFIVLAADHTYASVASVFPNGNVVEYDPRALPEGENVDQDDYDKAAEALVETLAGDVVSILDGLDQGAGGPFSKLRAAPDLERIGVYGHSAGGGGAVRACIEDLRCKAVAGLDAWVGPIPDRVVARELQQPSMFVRSDDWRGTPNDGRLRGLAERSPTESYWIDLVGAGHNDFTVAPLFSPVADRLGLKGIIPADRVLPILDTYLTGFFSRYLTGSGGSALDEPAPAEVGIEFLP